MCAGRRRRLRARWDNGRVDAEADADADDGPTGSPLLDLISARRREQAGPVQRATVEAEAEDGAAPPGPDPRSSQEPELREGPLAVAARLRRDRAVAGVEAGVVVSADGAPGRLHALHRRKTRGTATTDPG